VAVAVILAALGVATVYEALIAAGAIDLGTEPGAAPGGAGAVLAIALAAMLIGAVAAARWSGPRRRPQMAELLAPAAAAFLVARFYTFDPYYLPTLRRASDGGLVAPEVVYLLAGLALVAGLLVRLRPRVGLWLTSVVMIGCALFAWVAYGGH
jgi:hypothetical protein